MTTPRHHLRETALQILFQTDVGNQPIEEALNFALEERKLSHDNKEFLQRLTQGAWAHRSELDALIAIHAAGWSPNRMPNVDRNVLRMALFEIQHLDDIPVGVAINEAVELAKEYGTADSSRFVNGVLGAIVRELDRT